MGPGTTRMGLWTYLVRVAPTGNAALDRRGRFFASLVLVFIVPLVLVGMVVLPLLRAPQAPLQSSVFFAAVAQLPLTLASFWLNRFGRVMAASLLFVVSCLCTITYASLDDPSTLTFIVIVTIVSLGLFPLRGAVALNVAGTLLSHGTVLAVGDAPAAEVLFPLTVVAFCVTLATVVQRHQLRLEEERNRELRRRENWFSTTLRSIGDAVLTVDTDRRITFMNPVAELLTGRQAEEARGQPLETVFVIEQEDTGEPAEDPAAKVLRDGTIVGLANHTALVSSNGHKHPIADSGAPIVDDNGVTYGVVLVFRDMSEERAQEQTLQQSQRLNALGRLAGGIAHDFNNLLTVIGSGTALARDELPSEHPGRAELDTVLDASSRAVELTSRLLAFSRRQVLQPVVVRLGDVVTSTSQLLRRLLKENVRIVQQTEAPGGWVRMDPAQLEQVVINLAINAGDAMPTGGTLTISTSDVTVSEALRIASLSEGRYGLLRIQDTGVGIDPKVLPHVFEPFFTTKDDARGTGLGLATVYGIVEQSGGCILVQSELGQGTTFDVYLPESSKPEEPARRSAPVPPRTARSTTRTLFLAEDDDMVRKIAVRTLTQAGYRVVEAHSGSDALEKLAVQAGPLDLLITDVIMPGCGGKQVAERFRERFGELPVLFMSGYADEILAREGIGSDGNHFLPKPFTPEALKGAVRAAMAESHRAAGLLN
jgi:PAS domain S-box-containing protein